MDIGFQNASLQDLPQLLEWMRQNYTADRIEFNPDVARSAWLEVLNHEELGRAWIIEYGKLQVGYAVLSFGFSLQYKGRDAYLDELYIGPDFRDQGIGKAAMNFLEDYCRSQGIQAIHLEVSRQNVRAQNLYRKVGFQDHDHYLLTKWISQ